MTDGSLQGVRVFLVEDHPVVREGLSLLLANKGFVICGEANCREDALLCLLSAKTDVVLVDLALGHEDGIELIRSLNEQGVKSIVYSMHDEARQVKRAISSGAKGYVTKREEASILLEAIDCVLSGGCYLSPVAEAASQQSTPQEELEFIERLSVRELELFRKMGEGYSSTDLADHFAISPSTVETYYSRIMEKLNLPRTKEVRLMAIRFMKGR